MMKKIVDQGADAIALSPYEPAKFVEIVNDCIKKEVPVLTLNNDILNSSRLCYVGANYYKSGRMAGNSSVNLSKPGMSQFYAGNPTFGKTSCESPVLWK